MGSGPSQSKRRGDRPIKLDSPPISQSRVHPEPSPTGRNRRVEDAPWAEPRRRADGNLIWPLPTQEQYPPFRVIDNSRSDRFAFPALSPRSKTPSRRPAKASAEERYNERQSDSAAWEKATNSQTADSAHVQTQLTARFHACFNLSAVDSINVAMEGLTSSQTTLDERLKNRLTNISKAAADKMALAIDDTKKDQQTLLRYDKDRQHYLQAAYQEWLQKYVVELNEWMAKELARLDATLQQHQTEIVDVTERRIDRINREADDRKTRVLQEEQGAERRRAQQLTTTMYDAVRNNAQFLGSEAKTEVNLRIQANVGRIAPGQGCPVNCP